MTCTKRSLKVAAGIRRAVARKTKQGKLCAKLRGTKSSTPITPNVAGTSPATNSVVDIDVVKAAMYRWESLDCGFIVVGDVIWFYGRIVQHPLSESKLSEHHFLFPC